MGLICSNQAPGGRFPCPSCAAEGAGPKRVERARVAEGRQVADELQHHDGRAGGGSSCRLLTSLITPINRA